MRVLSLEDHHRTRFGAESREVRDAHLRPALRRVLEPRRGGNDRDAWPLFADAREDLTVQLCHERCELARAHEEQTAPAHRSEGPRAPGPPTSTARPWKRLYMRSKFRRLRLRRSSSESDSQIRCSWLRAAPSPSSRSAKKAWTRSSCAARRARRSCTSVPEPESRTSTSASRGRKRSTPARQRARSAG